MASSPKPMAVRSVMSLVLLWLLRTGMGSPILWRLLLLIGLGPPVCWRLPLLSRKVVLGPIHRYHNSFAPPLAPYCNPGHAGCRSVALGNGRGVMPEVGGRRRAEEAGGGAGCGSTDAVPAGRGRGATTGVPIRAEGVKPGERGRGHDVKRQRVRLH